jgi:hypothetical protein
MRSTRSNVSQLADESEKGGAYRAIKKYQLRRRRHKSNWKGGENE